MYIENYLETNFMVLKKQGGGGIKANFLEYNHGSLQFKDIDIVLHLPWLMTSYEAEKVVKLFNCRVLEFNFIKYVM